MPPEQAYAFHDADLTEAQLRYLQQCLDDNTRRQLDAAGLQSGWRCLEVGAGAGSIADYLHWTVGADGYVLATDLHPDRIRAECDTLAHDLVTEPIPQAGTWNLIHARLVELHLPQRRQIVAKLADALAPGGTLVLESFDCRTPPLLLHAPDGTDRAMWTLAIGTVLQHLQNAGADLSWALSCHAAMRESGLSDVVAETFNRTWMGGSAGTLLHTVNLTQLADRLDSLTASDVEQFHAIATHPDTVAWFYPMISTRGVKP